jgi:two-component system, OmpR family, response regulator ResD
MSKTILIIEDEADIRTLYAEVLRESGYNVHEAPDGTVGLSKAYDENWDLLLLDIVLPGNDGVNILKKIKGNPDLKKRPVLLLTNLGVEHVIHDCFNIGAEGYLIKSEITPDRIVEEVGHFVHNEPQDSIRR